MNKEELIRFREELNPMIKNLRRSGLIFLIQIASDELALREKMKVKADD